MKPTPKPPFPVGPPVCEMHRRNPCPKCENEGLRIAIEFVVIVIVALAMVGVPYVVLGGR